MPQQPNLVAYGFNQALQVLAQVPIVANRAPTTADMKPIGTLWVFSSSNAPYILTSISNNSATWQLIESSGGVGNFSSLTVNPGNATITAGNLAVTAGNLTVGGTTLLSGLVTASATFTDTAGQIVSQFATNTAALASEFVAYKTRAAGAAVQTGDALGAILFYGQDTTPAQTLAGQITVSATGTIGAGQVPGQMTIALANASGVLTTYATLGDTGNLTLAGTTTSGNLVLSGGTSAGNGGNISTTWGTISSTNSGFAGLYTQVTGDPGAGVLATTTFTSGTNTTQSTGTLSIKSTTANSGNNAGFLKIYVGTVVNYIPYFTVIAP